MGASERFISAIDTAVVAVNTSTRFTDGDEFGFGAEIGNSTQKLHVRGPMGLESLTSERYVLYGDGQVRQPASKRRSAARAWPSRPSSRANWAASLLIISD